MRVGSVGSTAMYLARDQLHIDCTKSVPARAHVVLLGLPRRSGGRGRGRGRCRCRGGGRAISRGGGGGRAISRRRCGGRAINRRRSRARRSGLLFLARGWNGGRRRAINRRSGLLFLARGWNGPGNSWRGVQVEDRGIKCVIGPAVVRGTVVKRIQKFAPWMQPLESRNLGAELLSDILASPVLVLVHSWLHPSRCRREPGVSIGLKCLCAPLNADVCGVARIGTPIPVVGKGLCELQVQTRCLRALWDRRLQSEI